MSSKSHVLWLMLVVAQYCYCYTLTDPRQAMQFVDSRLNGINNTLVIAQNQIVSIQGELNNMENSYQYDLKKLLAQITRLTEQLEKTSLQVDENEQKIDALTATVAQLNENFEQLEETVANLQEANRLWKNNFQIVNRTFTNLRSSGYLKSS